jgi:dTDP-4-dehydrorhamnose reductase
MNVLVIGASGMLGNAVLRFFHSSPGFEARGTVREMRSASLFPNELRPCLLSGVDAGSIDSLIGALEEVRPQLVINCVGLVKQLTSANDPLEAVPINSLFPHRLARLCGVAGARFVHMSTDCVFSGRKGMYSEEDFPDAEDLYGRSKLLGEVDYPNAITLRTSIIGHELQGGRSLIGWFLSQEGTVRGFRKAIFSGLPTVEVARVIRDHIVPHPELRGVYHLSAEPINKFDLLQLVANAYGKSVEIQADDGLVINRSLDSTRLRAATGFSPKPWPELIRTMKEFR